MEDWSPCFQNWLQTKTVFTLCAVYKWKCNTDCEVKLIQCEKRLLKSRNASLWHHSFHYHLCWLVKNWSSIFQVISVVMNVRSYKDLILTDEKRKPYLMRCYITSVKLPWKFYLEVKLAISVANKNVIPRS